MQQPRRFFLVRAGTAGAKYGRRFLRKLGLHKEIAERRMRLVRGWRCEHHFRITGQFDVARHG